MNAAIDLGNSRLKILRSDKQYAAWSLDAIDWAEVESFLAPVTRVVVSSVNPRREPELLGFLGQSWEVLSARALVSQRQLPISIVAEGVGVDRILGVLGALRYATPPLCVVDLGTVTTATVLDANRELLGGYLVPGIELQLRALSEHVPHLDVPESVQQWDHTIGRTTRSAIASGVCVQTAVFVMGVHAAAVSQCSAPSLTMILTGGRAAMLGEPLSLMKLPITIVPTLVAEGALSLLEN